MESNLKELLRRATPMLDEQADLLIEADIAANAHRFPPAAKTSSAMDNENVPMDEPEESLKNRADPPQNRQGEMPKQ